MTAVRAAAISASRNHALDGGAHEQRLIEQRADLQLRRKRLRRLRNNVLDPGDDLQGGALPFL